MAKTPFCEDSLPTAHPLPTHHPLPTDYPLPTDDPLPTAYPLPPLIRSPLPAFLAENQVDSWLFLVDCFMLILERLPRHLSP